MNAFYRIMAAMMIAGVTLASCEVQSPEPDDNGQPPVDNVEPDIQAGEDGDMTFEIETPGQVTVDGPLDMTIVQTSSYTDPDGTVYECSPKATISVAALKDTVFVTDISHLTAIGEAPAPETDKGGDSPVTHTISQEFQVGGQTVGFDLAYEVYTYVNSRKQNVEMPYVKLSPADLGSADATDTKGAVKLSDITVRSLAPETRTITVTDSTEYEVTVRFNLEAETANLAETSKQTIPFEVVYVGVVTETSTYPGAQYSYELKDGEGNSLSGTDYAVEPGSSFQLNLIQNSSYTDQNGAVTATPEAWTRISSPATLSIESVDELAARAGDIVIETHSDVLDGLLPYYRLGEVTLKGDVVTEEISRSEDGKTQLFKATATYTQTAVPVNMEDGKELEFTYAVSYLGELSVKLLDIEYDQQVIWEDAHDNIYTNSQIVITRRAKYSDGTLEETKFYSTKNFVQFVTSRDHQDSSGEIEYVDYSRVETVNTFVTSCATGVPDLEHFSFDICVDAGNNDFVNLNDYQGDSLWVYLSAYKGPTGKWIEYQHQETGELYDESTQKQGFYGKQFGYLTRITGEYIGDSYYPLRQYNLSLIYKDRFFCIDGKLFTVDPLEHTHRWSVETIETPNRGTCRLHKLEADVTWLGRDFYYAVVDTVYVKQPTAAPAVSSRDGSEPSQMQRSQVKRRTTGAPYAAQESDDPAMSLSVQTLPGSEPYTERTVIRPDGTRTTRRYDGIVTEFER